MEQIFRIMTVSASLYVAYLVYSSAKKAKITLRQQVFSALNRSLHSEKLQHMLKDVGWDITSSKFNLIRYGSIVSYMVLSYLTHYLRGEPFSTNVLLIALLCLFASSTSRFSPTSKLLKKMKERQIIHKDSELISFLKLYQSSRRHVHNNIQFWAFCMQVAPHFKYINKQLYHLSERIHEEGIEVALDWFVSCYPSDHPFIYEIRSIILTAENERDPRRVAIFLDQQNKSIADLSREQYQQRWSLISTITTIINVLPSAATFIMLILLVMQYIFIINKNSIVGF